RVAVLAGEVQVFEHCYTSSDWINCARINRYIALAYKARVCLFEGTYRKYHSVDPSTGKAWEDKQASEKFLRECAEACEELMAAGCVRCCWACSSS
ncbi:hypothetical protein NE555_17665, partial [Alistipes onderdonkii]|nr:hypothetical protein [Alistipes onderdonkii]